MFAFGCIVVNSHVFLFSFSPYLNPSHSIASKNLFFAMVSVEMHMVSSASVTSSKSVPGTLRFLNCLSTAVCMSWSSVVITVRDRYGDKGHPCLIPVLCGIQSHVYPHTSTQITVSLYNVFTYV